MLDGLASLFVKIYLSVVTEADLYEQEKGRLVFLSPVKLQEVFPLYERLVVERASELELEREQYQAGIRKLEEANSTIARLQDQLEKLGPELESKSKAVEASMKLLEREAKDVQEIESAVGLEAKTVAEQKSIAEGIKNECEARLQEAQP